MLFTKKKLDHFCVPISEHSICGKYIKLNKDAFRPLRNQYNEAQTALRTLCQNPSENAKEALQAACLQSWKTLSASLLDQFNTTTRDIELIGWFIAAQALLDPSLEGTANSIEWLSILVERHWDHLNPVLPQSKLKSSEPDAQMKEQTAEKVKAFFQLVGNSEGSSILYAPLLQLTLAGEISFYEFQSADKKRATGSIKAKAAARLTQERTEIEKKIENTARCITQINRLESAVAKQTKNTEVTPVNFGFVKSLFTQLDSALQELIGTIKDNKTESCLVEASNNTFATNIETSANIALAPSQTKTKPNPQVGPLHLNLEKLAVMAAENKMGRDLAFCYLREISNYFRQSEPHSPISFLLEKAIRWGHLSLPELFHELMADQNDDVMEKIFNVTGMNFPVQASLLHTEDSTGGTKSSSLHEDHVQQNSAADTKQKPKSHQPSSSTALDW